MNVRRLLCTALLALPLGGCHSIGPTAIRQNHPHFNDAIARTLDEQLLINVVRMRYLEPMFFLDIGTVTDSQRLAFGVGSDDSVLYGHPYSRRFDFNPTFSFDVSQTPTVSYVPMQGQSFVQRLFAPVPLPIILQSIQSGWSVQRVFGIFVERINNLPNAPTASGPTPLRVPEYEDFARLTGVMASLLRNDVLTMGIDPTDQNRLMVRLRTDSRHAQIIREFHDLLDLPLEGNAFTFRENFLDEHSNVLRLRTRSMQSAIFYLANGVQVPQEHLDAGLVPVTRNAVGEAFDWSRVLGGIFTVRCSAERPTDAFIATFLRGHWFYIADGDVSSKSTFMLLSSVFNLQAGDPHVVAPSLTIPVTAR